jgi:hypothetical protein
MYYLTTSVNVMLLESFTSRFEFRCKTNEKSVLFENPMIILLE